MNNVSSETKKLADAWEVAADKYGAQSAEATTLRDQLGKRPDWIAKVNADLKHQGAKNGYQNGKARRALFAMWRELSAGEHIDNALEKAEALAAQWQKAEPESAHQIPDVMKAIKVVLGWREENAKAKAHTRARQARWQAVHKDETGTIRVSRRTKDALEEIKAQTRATSTDVVIAALLARWERTSSEPESGCTDSGL